MDHKVKGPLMGKYACGTVMGLLAMLLPCGLVTGNARANGVPL